MKTKTNFCDRFFNLSPKICIYDLDGTIIDSSHRIKLHDNGSLDLEHWKQNSTKEMIFQDNLLPMYWQLVADYKEGNIIVICTAREFGKYDWEYLYSMGIYWDYVISRPSGINTVDHILKKNQLRHFWNLKQFKNLFLLVSPVKKEHALLPKRWQMYTSVSIIQALELSFFYTFFLDTYDGCD